MIRIVGLIIISCIAAQSIVAAGGQWRTITAMNQARDAVALDDVIYTVTNGGMFSYSNNGDIIETYTPADGLSAIDLRAVTIDKNGTIWIGSAGGFIDGLNPDDMSVRRVTDITRTDFPQRDITVLEARGDTIFVGTTYGISIYSISRNEFNDTYIKFGAFPTQTPVTSIVYDDTHIWVGTSQGVARGNIDDPLLAAPDRWTTFTTIDNIPHNMIKDLAIIDGTPFIATQAGVAWFDGVAWNSVDALIGTTINALTVMDNMLYAATDRDIFRIDQGGIISQYGPRLPAQINSLTGSNGTVIAVMNDLGIAVLRDNDWEAITPSGPNTNILTDIFIGDDNIIWIATASAPDAARGFYRYEPDASPGEQWKSFTVQQYSELRNNSYYKVSGSGDGTVWVSSHGRGITAVKPDGTLRNYYTGDGLVGIKGSETYVVPSRAAEDSRGNIWFTLYLMDEDKPLVKLDPGSSEITLFANDRNRSAIALRDVIVDRFDTKWIGSDQSGIFYYNENESIGSEINGWGSVTTTNGLPTNSVNVVTEDNRGEIWIGTNQGLAVVVNPRDPQNSVRDIFTLQNQTINSIAVDPLNRKWIGTMQGVFLLSPDGTQLLEQFNVDNTNNKLVSNEVMAVSFDYNTGIVYFGTNNGISSLQTVAVAPRASFDDLFISPNPYRIPSEHQVKIDGLVRNSSVKIMSVDGRLVRSFNTPGGRVAYWDGRDEAGRDVASGVYIVIGISEDGTEVGKSKMTVIRR